MIRTILLSLMLLATCATAQLQTNEFWSDWPTTVVPKESKEPFTLNFDLQWKLECSLDSGELIGKVSAAAPGSDGRILLLDDQLTQVIVMSSTGQIESIFGQEGDGPGDLPGSYRLLELSDGRIGVCGGVEAPTFLLGGSSKIVLFNQNFEPAGQWFGIGEKSTMLVATIRELRCARDNILVSSSGARFKDGVITQIQELAVIDPQDGSRTEISKRIIITDITEGKIIEADNFNPFAHGRCDISNTGRIAFAPDRDRWLLVIRNGDGTGFVLKREWEKVKRTRDQKKIIWKNMGGTEDCVALDYEPAIARVRWRPNGNLWVEPFGIEFRDGALACFDEFDPSGEYLRRIKVEVPEGGSTDDFQFLEDGRFVIFRGFKENPENDEVSDENGEVLLLKMSE